MYPTKHMKVQQSLLTFERVDESRFNPIVLQMTLCDPKSNTAVNTRPLLPHTTKIIHIKTQTEPVGVGKKCLYLALWKTHVTIVLGRPLQ